MIASATIILPTHGRPDKLANCLRAIAAQRLTSQVQLETIVAIDGGADTDDHANVTPCRNTSILRLPRVGVSAARNAAMQRAAGELLLFTNDDTYPAPEWVAAHIAAHHADNTARMVVGRTDACEWPDTTVFDGLLRDTSMIFFYDAMQPGATFGFRHFWTCNASIRAADARRVGGFDERLRPVFFEDVEFAFRVERKIAPGVHYVPGATNVHDHRLTWADYRRRERALGRMAAILLEANPACFHAIYGDATASAPAAAFDHWPRIDEKAVRAIESDLLQRLDRPLASIADWPTVCDDLYQRHLPIKRHDFLAAFAAQRASPASGGHDRRSGHQRRAHQDAVRAPLRSCTD